MDALELYFSVYTAKTLPSPVTCFGGGRLMLVLPAPSVRFCRICGRMCQMHDSKIDEQGSTVHTDCHATRMASVKSDVSVQANEVRRNRPITEYLHGFAVR
jgi:hypothetical protein